MMTLRAYVASSKGFCICPGPNSPRSPPRLALLQWLSSDASFAKSDWPDVSCCLNCWIFASASSCNKEEHTVTKMPLNRRPRFEPNQSQLNHAYKSQAHLHLIKHNQQTPLAIWAAINGKDKTTFHLQHITLPKHAVQSERGNDI